LPFLKIKKLTKLALKVSKKNKIAIVANTTWNIYNFRMNILEILTRNNFEIFVLAPVDKYIFYKESFPEVSHIQIKNLDRDSTNPIKDLLLFSELISIYKRIRPDLILHYTVKPNIYGGFAAGYLKIPSIAVVTGLGYAFIHNGFIKKITKILYRMSSGFHNQIVFENTDDRNLFIEEKLISGKKGISVKGCGVDTHFFSASRGKTIRNKLIFTFIGRLLYDKGVVEFVEAAKIIKSRYDNVEFWMIGEIDHSNPATVKEEDLILWVKSRTVIYHGFKDNIKKYIAQSDCIVLPSYREAIARTITEAMSMEKVVIATETAGCREAIEHGKNGLLVPVREINLLADAMEEIIGMSEETRLKMGKEGRIKAVSQFDERLIAHDIFKIIMDTLKETPEN
jgi:glycosyltransferase involved in cell wall biosynthesis